MHPKIELEIGGARRKVKVEAIVDTGFTGYVSIPLEIAKDLGLELSGEEEYELANGELVTQFLFKGYVVFLNRKFDVEILVGNSPKPQVGIMLLADCKLAVDFVSNSIEVTRIEM